MRHRLKKHINENSAILHRERHRERLYDSAQRMKNAGKFVPPKAPKVPPAVKVIQKTGEAFTDAVAKTSAGSRVYRYRNRQMRREAVCRRCETVGGLIHTSSAS